MPSVLDIYRYIDSLYPFNLQESWDNSGINIYTGSDIKKVHLTLDITLDVVNYAIETGADLIISHHPIIFNPLSQLDPEKAAVKLAAHNISAICMHTNFDTAKGGMNDILCRMLELEPTDEPLTVENGVGIGRICKLKRPAVSAELARDVKVNLAAPVLRYIPTKQSIVKVAVVSGSGGKYCFKALEKRCQALITGDVSHNYFVDMANEDFCIIDAGHFYTEQIFFSQLTDDLKKKFQNLDVTVSPMHRDVTEYIL